MIPLANNGDRDADYYEEYGDKDDYDDDDDNDDDQDYVWAQLHLNPTINQCLEDVKRMCAHDVHHQAG